MAMCVSPTRFLQSPYFFFDSPFIGVAVRQVKAQDLGCLLQVAAQSFIVIGIRQIQGLLIQPLFHVLGGRAGIFQEIDIRLRFAHGLVFFIGLAGGEIVDSVAPLAEHDRQFIVFVDGIVIDDIVDSLLFRQGLDSPHELAPAEDIRRKAPLQSRNHVAVDEIDVGIFLTQRIVDDVQVDVQEMLHTAGKAFDALRTFGHIVDDMGNAIDHHLFQIAFDQVFIGQGDHGETAGTVRDFIGRQDDTVKAAGAADVDFVTTGDEHGRMGDGPVAPGRRSILQADMERLGERCLADGDFSSVRRDVIPRHLGWMDFIFVNHALPPPQQMRGSSSPPGGGSSVSAPISVRMMTRPGWSAVTSPMMAASFEYLP